MKVQLLEQERDKLLKDKADSDKKLNIAKKIQEDLFAKLKTIQSEKEGLEKELKSLSLTLTNNQTQQVLSENEPTKKKKSKKNKKKKKNKIDEELTSDKNNTETTDLSITDEVNLNTISKEIFLSDIKVNIIDSPPTRRESTERPDAIAMQPPSSVEPQNSRIHSSTEAEKFEEEKIQRV